MVGTLAAAAPAVDTDTTFVERGQLAAGNHGWQSRDCFGIGNLADYEVARPRAGSWLVSPGAFVDDLKSRTVMQIIVQEVDKYYQDNPGKRE